MSGRRQEFTHLSPLIGFHCTYRGNIGQWSVLSSTPDTLVTEPYLVYPTASYWSKRSESVIYQAFSSFPCKRTLDSKGFFVRKVVTKWGRDIQHVLFPIVCGRRLRCPLLAHHQMYPLFRSAIHERVSLCGGRPVDIPIRWNMLHYEVFRPEEQGIGICLHR